MARRSGRVARGKTPYGPDDIRTVFAKNVREARDRLDLTQEDVAKACGERYSTVISRIEGGRNVTLETLQVLARALRVTEADLLQRPKKPTTQKPE